MTEKRKYTKRGISTYRGVPLEVMIQQLQAAGYKITPASTSEDEAKQEESKTKLGIKRKVIVVDPPQPKLITTLCINHYIAGVQYGPGRIELEPGQTELFNQLVYQDRLARAHYMDVSVANPYVRSFMIADSGRSGNMRHLKIEVNERNFSHLLDPRSNGGGFTFGQVDAAGFTPHINRDGTF